MPHRLPCLVRIGAVSCALVLGFSVLGSAGPVALASVEHHSVVDEQPVPWTPHVLDGRVHDVVQVGATVIVGGEFTEVSDPDRGATVERENIFAFEYGTGEILTGFAPRLNGRVVSLAAAEDGVFVGGSFTRVNGERQRGLTRLDLDGQRSAGFADATLDDGLVYTLDVHGGQVYAGGSFTRVNGVPRVGLARLDGADGTLDPELDLPVSREFRGTLRVQEMALSPTGSRLVINGTFLEVDGHSRPQIAMIDTASRPARVTPWATDLYTADCAHSSVETYMRQMDFAPDGSYFAVVTTGGPSGGPGLCKSTTRWETDDDPQATPTWVNYTGGDSLYSVAVTGPAVYVGGHQRWLDNRHGDNFAGPDAVSREGIGAIHPVSGRALPWNPGRSRGHGVQALVPTPQGLFVGSDTETLAGEYRARLGMFPLP